MEVLAAHQEAIEPALDVRLADWLNLHVELICDATMSVPCEIDERDQGHGADDRVEGSLAAGSKTDKAPRKRGLATNGRSDAPQIGLGLAVPRAGLPVRRGVVPGHTVDVSPMAQVQDDVRGWQLSRWVLVGAAGRVSQDTRKKLSESGGTSLWCMPMRRGDDVTTEVLQRPGR